MIGCLKREIEEAMHRLFELQNQLNFEGEKKMNGKRI